MTRAPLFSILVLLSLILVFPPVTSGEEDMVLIGGGDYIVGEDGKSVSLDPFLIDKYEVKNGEYVAFLNDVYPDVGDEWLSWVGTEENSGFMIEKTEDGSFRVTNGYEDYPVVTVSWEGAIKYAEWADKTLPTSEQWEAAARGGSAARFPWGDEIDQGRANFFKEPEEQGNTEEGEKPKIMPVGSYDPNAYGLYDVIGNVWEWTRDDYATDYLSFVPSLGLKAAAGDTLKVTMGGSFLTKPDEISVSITFPISPISHFGNVGFRCVRELE